MRRELKIELTADEIAALLDEQTVLRRALVSTIDDRGGVIEVGADEVNVMLEVRLPTGPAERHECDCGRVYRSVHAVHACQTRNHGQLPNPPSRREDMRGESQERSE